MTSRTVVAVGASSGVGRATVLALAARGDRVVLVGREPTALAAVAAQCERLGGIAVPVVADTTSPADLRRVVDAAREPYGRIDAWVQTALSMAYGSVDETEPDLVRAALDTSVVGTWCAAQAVLPVMRQQPGGGVFVVVTSLLGRITAPSMGAYVVSKWAQRALVRVLQQENRRWRHVHICDVWPGPLNTPVYERAANRTGRRPSPPPPVQQPEVMADAVLDAIDRPRRSISVGPANAITRLGYVAVPPVYDALVGPLMLRLVLRKGPVPPYDGAALRPLPGLGHVHGPRARRGINGFLGRRRG